MTEFSRQPLELSEIDPKLQRHVVPDAPAKLKMMAARAMLPAPPDQMIRVLYQLQFDADHSLQKAAQKALAEMPEGVLGPAIQQIKHAGLLDWVGEVHAKNDAVGMILARNAATADPTIIRLCERAGPQLADIIATNQVRALRAPQIIEALYKNPAVSSATIDALVELAQRNKVELKGLPGLNAAIRSGQNLVGAQDGVDDSVFSALLSEEAQLAEEEDAKLAKVEKLSKNMTRSQLEKLRAEDPTLAEDADSDAPEDSPARGNLISQIAEMSIAQKIRMATVGSREMVKVLIRDQNKLVHIAAIRSPRIKPADVAKLASNKSLPDGVIEYIANNRDWTQKYDVIKNLVHNPKTPLRESLKFLNHLRTKDLRDLGRSRNVSHQVARAAQGLARKRSGG